MIYLYYDFQFTIYSEDQKNVLNKHLTENWAII